MRETTMSEDVVQDFESGLGEVSGAFAGAFEAAGDEPALRAANAKLVGPQGQLTKLLKRLKEVPNERKREFGQRANELKQQVQGAFDARLTALEKAARTEQVRVDRQVAREEGAEAPDVRERRHVARDDHPGGKERWVHPGEILVRRAWVQSRWISKLKMQHTSKGPKYPKNRRKFCAKKKKLLGAEVSGVFWWF